ncbi:hypothetical protein EYZ11_007480 [Aspergillus tanneri]|uniref:Uncharacterized protein n=1 Tax=Aspergillus tanneri TaxID=1220188 RepID=A0A4V3UNY9_9EURO|nr:uncharacterized protein ATNIH1004_006016 [Aspergillus tanneri]KAA8647324.1 hypothetical protein ATNIH1004_006016 [Aspergillus tanneri]THC93054.1 hypothetical protein EYZ11_007480 [Aspergillus tanneri]
MSERPSRPSSSHQEPPRKSEQFKDPGAQESVASNSDDEHFSDASEGQLHTHSHTPSGRISPVPLTRVETVDDNPSHGEIPGIPADEKRVQDGIPDEAEVIPEGPRRRSSSTAGYLPRPSAVGSLVHQTVVEKVDLDLSRHGDIPGTLAYEQPKADAVPDVVMKASDSDGRLSHSPISNQQTPAEAKASDMSVPETVLSKVDSLPVGETSSDLHAHQRRPSDTSDVTKIVPDTLGPLSSSESKNDEQSDNNPKHSVMGNDDQTTEDQAPADDFADFAEEQNMGEDDFGDFDDGFQEPSAEVTEDEFIEPNDMRPSQPPTPPSVPPLIDFNSFQSLPDLYAALDEPLDRLFPTWKDISSQSVEPIQNSSAIFNTERSLSLWSQLVAPPPLQPHNWVKSRIRRLFLVSLGVPVDLDEILPASKQKKLVLPSINIGSDAGGSTTHSRSQSQNRKDGTLSGSGSPRTSGQGSRQRTSRRREPNPPPELDLPAVHRLCTTTDAALEGLTDDELQGHVKELQDVTLRASSVLEYWLKRLDGLVSEKEAFEGVIENLVNHARRVRK